MAGVVVEAFLQSSWSKKKNSSQGPDGIRASTVSTAPVVTTYATAARAVVRATT
jgi:hypothetical protein